jgi:alpha/beta superfamily hydrolase
VDVARHVAQFWETSHAPDELDLGRDLQAAVGFLRLAVGPILPLALVGYSFGCSLLPRAVHADTPTPLVLIAPTVGTHGYDAFESAAGPKLVIAPEGDFAADPECLRRWFARLPGPRRLVPARGDGHFFRGQEGWLVETVGGFLHEQWR